MADPHNEIIGGAASCPDCGGPVEVIRWPHESTKWFESRSGLGRCAHCGRECSLSAEEIDD